MNVKLGIPHKYRDLNHLSLVVWREALIIVSLEKAFTLDACMVCLLLSKNGELWTVCCRSEPHENE